MTLAPELKMSDGQTIPQIGLGTWPMKDQESAKVIAEAIEIGYRHFDSAVNYQNEAGVAEGMRASGVGREELFVTTKVPGRDHGYQETKASLEGTLERMKLDYVDLYLIHWPNPIEDRYVDTWRAFVDLQKEGKAKSIGVSNFKPAHLERLKNEVGVLPAINQIQLFPGIAQNETREYNESNGILTESWSPLGRAGDVVFNGTNGSFLELPFLLEMAEKYSKTTAQVILRWHVQLGLIPLPKSSSKERLAQNLDVFNFELDDQDMKALSVIDGALEVWWVADSDTHQEF